MSGNGKSIVIGLDGTWQNAYKAKERDDGSEVLKPSNVLKLCRAVAPLDPGSGRNQITFYSTGVGAIVKYPGVANSLDSFFESRLGGGWGAGFEAGVEASLRFLVHNYSAGDKVFVFGFSRGAAQARALTRFIDWLGGLPTKRDAYFVPLLFQKYIQFRGRAKSESVKTSGEHGLSAPLTPINITMLGVWDTVMSLGSRFRAAGAHTSSRERTFHIGNSPAECVQSAFQALSINEKRFDFRPEIWRSAYPGISMEQRWFAGCHSNIGGGYVHDGLANIPLRWIVTHSEELGLYLDHEIVKYYRPFPQAQLYSTWTAGYRVIEALRLRRGRGCRSLVDQPQSANLSLDPSVIHRLRSDPAGFDQLALYRPRNVLEYLRTQGDLDTFITRLGLDPSSPPVPQDLRAAVNSQRRWP